MKKVLLSLGFLLVLFTGCGTAKEKTVDCTLKSTNSVQGYTLNSTYTIYYKGNSVNSVKTKEVVESEDESILDYFEETLRTSYESAQETYGGYKNTVERDDTKVTSTTEIDYNEMDMKKYIDDNTAVKSYVNKDNKFTLSGIKSVYESMGAVCE